MMATRARIESMESPGILLQSIADPTAECFTIRNPSRHAGILPQRGCYWQKCVIRDSSATLLTAYRRVYRPFISRRGAVMMTAGIQVPLSCFKNRLQCFVGTRNVDVDLPRVLLQKEPMARPWRKRRSRLFHRSIDSTNIVYNNYNLVSLLKQSFKSDVRRVSR